VSSEGKEVEEERGNRDSEKAQFPYCEMPVIWFEVFSGAKNR
jgi:hypothetical protein